MANGYPIAAVVGKREVLSMYEKAAFLSLTFFPNSLEMAAAMACMDILEREDVQNVIWERGTRFLERLGQIIDASGAPVTKSGIPPMPFLTFDKVDEHYKERRVAFYTQCIRRGLFVQPYHHWYIAYRHTEQDLDRALEVVEERASPTWRRTIRTAHNRVVSPGTRGRTMDKLIITVAGVGADDQGGAAGAARSRRRRSARTRPAAVRPAPASTTCTSAGRTAPRRRTRTPSRPRWRRSASAQTSSSRPRRAAPWA